MAVKKIKKDFSKDQMYAKIMPSLSAVQSAQDEPPEELPPPAPKAAARYVLRNYMEDIVLEKLSHTMQMLKSCTCEKCKKDVMAEALNMLPAAYMTVEPDQIETAVKQLRNGMDIKVSAALIKAVQTVKADPHH